MEFLIPFRNPWVLLALLLPAGLLLWTWMDKGSRLILPFDHSGERRGRVLGALLALPGSLPEKFFLGSLPGSLPRKNFGIPGGIRGIKKMSVRIFDFVNKFT